MGIFSIRIITYLIFPFDDLNIKPGQGMQCMLCVPHCCGTGHIIITHRSPTSKKPMRGACDGGGDCGECTKFLK